MLMSGSKPAANTVRASTASASASHTGSSHTGSSHNSDMQGFHWVLDILQSVDVGLVVIDRHYNIHTWNLFMENHSNIKSTEVIGDSLFATFPEIPEQWFRNKSEAVFTLDNSAYITWEQRPHVFRFRSYRPVTGVSDFMYQNITMIPLHDVRGRVDKLVIIIYDVTDSAESKLELERMNKEIERIGRIDGLTQLQNRACWESDLEREYARCLRYGHCSTLLMFDIDFFKKVNDSWGHQAGDDVIRYVAKLLRDTKRTTDIAGRYGGEEFGVVLVNTPVENATVFAERLRQAVETCCVEHAGHAIRFTISIGLAKMVANADGYMHWLQCADKALYYAKGHGRNQVVAYSSACESLH
jgi:diguanylate cyclase